MRFQVLGPLQVTVGGEALVLGAPQQRKLLALLCTAPNVSISADRLMDEIWGEHPPRSAPHLVQVYVSRLRKLLGDLNGEPRVARSSAGYMLRAEQDEVDSLQLVAMVGEVEATGDHDSAVIWRSLGAITEMWRGPPFGELADDSDMLRLEAIRLTEIYVSAVEDRVAAGLEMGCHRILASELESLVAQHPYRERLWQQLMVARYRSGHQVGALRAFRAVRTRLAEDLGLEPGPELSDLEGRILLHDRELLWEPPPPPSNLPPSPNAFIGREVELASVGDLLERSRLVTLTGPGGIGKTRLAIEAARRHSDRYPDGVWWIDLSPLPAGDSVLAVVARVLGVSAQPGLTLLESAVQSLVRRNTLLVVDNCEHVVPSVAELVAAALRSADRVQVLATSRVPLHIAAEALWIVPPLSMPRRDHTSPSQAACSDAVQLFTKRGDAAAPAFEVGAENVGDVVEVCRRAAGMPLAIEMSAAHLRVMSPGEIANDLGSRFDVLEKPDSDNPARHQTLQAAFDWSYHLLDPEIRTAFDNLAVFPGSFDVDAAGEIAFPHITERNPLETMAVLVDASMVSTVVPSVGGTRFRLLETLRDYGVGHLRDADELVRLRSRHAGYFVSRFREAGRHIGEAEFAQWITRLDDCYDDVQQTLEQKLHSPQPNDALELAPPLAHYWYRTGDARQACRWGMRMLDDSDGAAPELQASAHAAVAFGSTITTADPAAALTHSEKAVALYRDSGDQRGLVFGLFGHANAGLLAGDIGLVGADAAEGLALSEEIGYAWGRGACLCMLAFAGFFGEGSLDEARARAVAGVSHLRSVGDVGGQVVLNLASAIALRQGDLDSAERYALDTAGIASGSGWEAAALDNLAQVYIAKRRLDRAEATLRRAVTRALDTGLENWFRVALRDLAQVAQRRGDSAKAATLVGASRRNMPMWGLDPNVYEELETACTSVLGPRAYREISDEGYQMGVEKLLELALPT